MKDQAGGKIMKDRDDINKWSDVKAVSRATSRTVSHIQTH